VGGGIEGRLIKPEDFPSIEGGRSNKAVCLVPVSQASGRLHGGPVLIDLQHECLQVGGGQAVEELIESLGVQGSLHTIDWLFHGSSLRFHLTV